MTEKKQLIFDPGCFDDFDGTQEELDEIIAEINKMFENGSLEDNSREVDLEELFETDPETAEKIINSLHRTDNNEPPRILQ